MIKFSSVSGLRRSICPIVMGLLIVSQFVHPSFAQNTENVPLERRAKLLQLIPDGLIILPSETVEKKMEQPFWVQDPSFFYFTSLLGAPGAILVMDGPKERSILFSGPDVSSFGMPLTDLNIANRKDWIEQSGISAVLSLSEFETYIQSRLNDGVQTIYLDKPRREKPSEAPPGFLEVSGFHRLWEQSIRTAFPAAKLASVSSEIDGLVWVKNVDEISQLRKNATVSAKALTSGMLYIRPEKTQRQAEGQVVGACLEEGAEGPSFWPWVMTGPNAHIQNVVKSFYDPVHLNRSFLNGELVRVDIGCAGGGYGGDVGRTVPVSGTFTQDQAIVWDALVAGYFAGIEVMKHGTTLAEVVEASRTGLVRWSESHPESQEVVKKMNNDGGVSWHLHGIGIESGETAQPVLMAGAVIAYEPMFVWGPDAYYLEDMILITPEGTEILTPGLPYGSLEMHAFLESNR